MSLHTTDPAHAGALGALTAREPLFLQGGRTTWRSSLWRRTGPTGWQVVFHRGTVVQPDGP